MPVSTCPNRDVLSRYLAGQVSAVESAMVEEHLDGCERCTTVMSELDSPVTKLRGLNQPIDRVTAETEVRQAVEKAQEAFAQFASTSVPTVLYGPETRGPNTGVCRVALCVEEGPHQGRRFEFDQHENFIVGRGQQAHFRLPKHDPYFSRIHFMVEVNPPLCQLVDMRSLNGTKLNGQPVHSAVLRQGDLIRGGATAIRVTLEGFDEPNRTESLPAHSDGRPSAVPPSVPGYTIERELGRGGMGVVYSAIHCKSGTRVALKIIRPSFAAKDREMQRFLREAEILCALQHPHIVSFHEMGATEAGLFFSMRFVDGRDAHQHLSLEGRFAIGRAVRLIGQVLEALDYAHRQGFVHRDIKPANLLIEQAGGVEVCHLADFGLARVYHNSQMSGLTLFGDVGGTVPFMAPEQITNYRNVAPAADQYATAATLYRLLTNEWAYEFGKHPTAQRLATVLLDEPVPILQRRPEIPVGLATAIHRALQKKPEDRFPDAASFWQAIQPFL